MKNYCTINTDKYRLTERTIDLLNTHGSPIATPDYMCYIVCFPDIEAVLAVDIGVTGSWQVFPADPRGKCGKRKQKKYLEYLLDTIPNLDKNHLGLDDLLPWSENLPIKCKAKLY